MTKALITASELEKLIQDAISTSKALDGDCIDCKVNAVYWHEPDESGSNWDLHSFNGSSVCADFILSVVAKFKSIYNLKE